ncbi:SMR family transporter [Desulfitobacterium sp. THU1]|uniref:DMT family transporter n=1 Tax=Desulfitobacterium sp. THU1 TaxID=3138072 RepID=UPI00311D5C5A
MNRNWLKVFVAAFLEVIWVIGLAHAFDFWTWSGTIITLVISNYLMITAAQILPAGTVYTVFVGLGTAGTIVAEIIFFAEPFKWEKILLIVILLIGVIGLKSVTDNRTEEGAES